MNCWAINEGKLFSAALSRLFKRWCCAFACSHSRCECTSVTTKPGTSSVKSAFEAVGEGIIGITAEDRGARIEAHGQKKPAGDFKEATWLSAFV